jgi:hypothetical protein
LRLGSPASLVSATEESFYDIGPDAALRSSALETVAHKIRPSRTPTSLYRAHARAREGPT